MNSVADRTQSDHLPDCPGWRQALDRERYERDRAQHFYGQLGQVAQLVGIARAIAENSGNAEMLELVDKLSAVILGGESR